MGLWDAIRGKPPTKPDTVKAPALAPLSDEEIEAMPLTQIMAAFKGTMPSGELMMLSKRLYRIALFDHGIADADRENAFALANTVHETLERHFTNQPDTLEKLRAARASMLEHARVMGYGTLVWLIGEEKVPSDKVIPFLMQPRHGHLLAHFLRHHPEPGSVATAKPSMIRELIASRYEVYGAPANCLVQLHAMVTAGDLSAHGLFTAEEVSALKFLPDDYAAARKVLVNAGLVAASSDSPPFRTDDIIGTEGGLEGLIKTISQARDQTLEKDAFLASLAPAKRAALTDAMVALRVNLVYRLVYQICGVMAASKLLGIFKSQESANLVDRSFASIAKIEKDVPLGQSIDFFILDSLLSNHGLSPPKLETEDAWNSYRRELEPLVLALARERAGLIVHLRLLMRMGPSGVDYPVHITEDWLGNPSDHLAP
jgi:hypothetical protein